MALCTQTKTMFCTKVIVSFVIKKKLKLCRLSELSIQSGSFNDLLILVFYILVHMPYHKNCFCGVNDMQYEHYYRYQAFRDSFPLGCTTNSGRWIRRFPLSKDSVSNPVFQYFINYLIAYCFILNTWKMTRE